MSMEAAIAVLGVCGVVIAAILKVPLGTRASRANMNVLPMLVTDDLCKARTASIERSIASLAEGQTELRNDIRALRAELRQTHGYKEN